MSQRADCANIERRKYNGWREEAHEGCAEQDESQVGCSSKPGSLGKQLQPVQHNSADLLLRQLRCISRKRDGEQDKSRQDEPGERMPARYSCRGAIYRARVGG